MLHIVSGNDHTNVREWLESRMLVNKIQKIHGLKRKAAAKKQFQQTQELGSGRVSKNYIYKGANF